MTDPERAEILEILSHKRHIPCQKCIILALLLHPQGLTIYELMDIMYHGKVQGHRRTMQRNLEYLLGTGAVIRDPYKNKGRNSHGQIYKIGLKT